MTIWSECIRPNNLCAISEMISGSKFLSRRRLISEDVFTFLSSKILYSFLASDIWLFNEKIFQSDLSPKKIWDIKKINMSKEKTVIRFRSKFFLFKYLYTLYYPNY